MTVRLQFPTVSRLRRQLEDGSLSLDEFAAEFSRRDWTIPAMSVGAIQRGDDDPPRANDWRDVESPRRRTDHPRAVSEGLKAAREPMLTRPEPT